MDPPTNAIVLSVDEKSRVPMQSTTLHERRKFVAVECRLCSWWSRYLGAAESREH
jgi:hypothetical protein